MKHFYTQACVGVLGPFGNDVAFSRKITGDVVSEWPLMMMRGEPWKEE